MATSCRVFRSSAGWSSAIEPLGSASSITAGLLSSAMAGSLVRVATGATTAGCSGFNAWASSGATTSCDGAAISPNSPCTNQPRAEPAMTAANTGNAAFACVFPGLGLCSPNGFVSSSSIVLEFTSGSR